MPEPTTFAQSSHHVRTGCVEGQFQSRCDQQQCQARGSDRDVPTIPNNEGRDSADNARTKQPDACASLANQLDLSFGWEGSGFKLGRTAFYRPVGELPRRHQRVKLRTDDSDVEHPNDGTCHPQPLPADGAEYAAPNHDQVERAENEDLKATEPDCERASALPAAHPSPIFPIGGFNGDDRK